MIANLIFSVLIILLAVEIYFLKEWVKALRHRIEKLENKKSALQLEDNGE